MAGHRPLAGLARAAAAAGTAASRAGQHPALVGGWLVGSRVLRQGTSPTPLAEAHGMPGDVHNVSGMPGKLLSRGKC